MRLTLFLIFLAAFVSCSRINTPSVFYDDCSGSPLILSDGIEVSDTLGYFSYKMPDSSWLPQRYLGENTTGLTIGDISSEGHWFVFNASHSFYTGEWNWEVEQKNVESDFNVIETGNISLLGQERPYSIVHFHVDSPQTISFYVTILDTVKKSNYTLNLTTDYDEDYKSRICEMKPLLGSFRILD
ncbi:hypothetical protein N9O54_05470 [Schleiferiaceae bacterium]|nr:hypothetical protein [Schleiferiaceae bacterium]MDA9192514.1 hypothetical protein [Schleiferiaceae bacterium]